MPERSLVPVGTTFGTRKFFTATDLEDDKALTQHSFIPVIINKSTNTRHYFHGYGVNNADSNVGRLGFDLQVADDAAGTNAAAAQGVIRAAVYPDEQMDVPKATGDEFTLSEMRDLEALNVRDRELFPVQRPGAAKDEYIVWEVKVDASQEGQVVYAEGSSGQLPRTERKIQA